MAPLIFVLDAAALLNNESFSFSQGHRYFTTSKVFSEWKDFRSKALAENAFAQGLLAVQDPCPLSVQNAIDLCQGTGTRLGDTDISIVALSLELLGRGEKVVVITDDYSVQNALKKAGANFIGVAQGEIRGYRDFRKHGKKTAT